MASSKDAAMSYDMVTRVAEYHEESDLRFLLLGKTGCGKSTTGNTILGGEEFDSKVSFRSVTENCSLRRSTRFGRTIEILDSPGLFDTSKTHEEVSQIVMQAVACMYPGPDAVLYVMKIGRYTEEEFGVYNRLKALLDDRVTKHIIVIFTFGDTLKGADIKEILKESPGELQQVLKECSNRYVVFDNTAEMKDEQVKLLLSAVRQLQTENQNTPYTCPKYSSIGEKMEAEVARRLAEIEKQECERKRYVQGLNQKLGDTEKQAQRERIKFQRKQKEMDERSDRMNDQLQNLKTELANSKLHKEEQARILHKLQMQQEQERSLMMQEIQQERSRSESMLKELAREKQRVEEALQENAEKFERYQYETSLAAKHSAEMQQELQQTIQQYNRQIIDLQADFSKATSSASEVESLRTQVSSLNIAVSENRQLKSQLNDLQRGKEEMERKLQNLERKNVEYALKDKAAEEESKCVIA